MGVEMFIAKEFFVIFPEAGEVPGRADGRREFFDDQRVASRWFGWLSWAWRFPVKERRACRGCTKGQGPIQVLLSVVE